MDPQVQSSFIPKKPLDSSVRGASAFGLFFFIALLFFIASLIAAGAVFAYDQYLNTQLAAKAKSLELSEGAFDRSVIGDLITLDTRMIQAQILLGKHVAMSQLFSFVGSLTRQNVVFKGITASLQSDGSVAIKMDGTADSFATVALQSDLFGSSKYLKNVVFSGVTLGDKGTATFSVSATVDPSIVLYSNEFKSASASSTTQ